jgi:hypothetical protein
MDGPISGGSYLNWRVDLFQDAISPRNGDFGF